MPRVSFDAHDLEPGNHMSIKSLCTALLIAAFAASGFAAVPKPTERTAVFVADAEAPGKFALDGFGRANGGGTGAARNAFADSTNADGDFTPFHDRWFFSGLLAGDYAFDTIIDTTGGLRFDYVTLSWLTEDGPAFIDFDVNADGTQASGSGIFSILSDGCKKCLWLDIYGVEDVSSARGYGGDFNGTVVPEPQTYGLMLAGLGVLAAFMARRRRQ
jgi:PEP-CTERM motif